MNFVLIRRGLSKTEPSDAFLGPQTPIIDVHKLKYWYTCRIDIRLVGGAKLYHLNRRWTAGAERAYYFCPSQGYVCYDSCRQLGGI